MFTPCLTNSNMFTVLRIVIQHNIYLCSCPYLAFVYFCYITCQLLSNARLRTFLPQDILLLYKQVEWFLWMDYVYNFKHVFNLKRMQKIVHQRDCLYITQFKAPDTAETQTRNTSYTRVWHALCKQISADCLFLLSESKLRFDLLITLLFITLQNW